MCFCLAEALALEAVAVKTQLTDACFGDGADNFRTIVVGAGVEGGGGVDGSDGSAYGIGVNNFLRRLLDALVLEGAKALKVATEVRWSATRSLAVHSLMMHSLAESSSATEALALEAAALIMAAEARLAAALTIFTPSSEELLRKAEAHSLAAALKM